MISLKSIKSILKVFETIWNLDMRKSKIIKILFLLRDIYGHIDPFKKPGKQLGLSIKELIKKWYYSFVTYEYTGKFFLLKAGIISHPGRTEIERQKNMPYLFLAMQDKTSFLVKSS